MMIADYEILVNENINALEGKLARWRQALEKNILEII